jgi:hypothetical protein
MQEFLIFSVAYLAGIASKIIWENMCKNKKSLIIKLVKRSKACFQEKEKIL